MTTERDEFLARMSHEFRTPLNAVIGFARVLESNRAGNQRPEDIQLLGRVRANGEKLLRVVEDMLEQNGIVWPEKADSAPNFEGSEPEGTDTL